MGNCRWRPIYRPALDARIRLASALPSSFWWQFGSCGGSIEPAKLLGYSKSKYHPTCSFVLLLASDILGFWILLTPQANLPSGSSNFCKRCISQQNWTAQLRGPKWSTCLYTSHYPALALGSRLFISPFQQLIKIKGESKFLEFLIGFQVKDVMEFLLYAREGYKK